MRSLVLNRIYHVISSSSIHKNFRKLYCTMGRSSKVFWRCRKIKKKVLNSCSVSINSKKMVVMSFCYLLHKRSIYVYIEILVMYTVLNIKTWNLGPLHEFLRPTLLWKSEVQLINFLGRVDKIQCIYNMFCIVTYFFSINKLNILFIWKNSIWNIIL